MKFTRYLNRHPRCAFTLIELLVVTGIFLVLVAVALPVTKGLLVENKATRASQSLAAFIEVARNRAIIEGRTFGVRIERVGNGSDPGDVDADRSTAIQFRHLSGMPPYSGDAADASVLLRSSGGANPIDSGIFFNRDCPLLFLSAALLASGDSEKIARSPIKIGDLIELPGGHVAPIASIQAFNSPGFASDATLPASSVLVRFDMNDPLRDNVGGIVQSGGVNVSRFPTAFRPPTGTGDRVPFKIQRSPIPSTNSVFELPRGLAIDLNHSGIGLTENDFAPPSDPNIAPPLTIDILFNFDGSVSQVTLGNQRVYPQSAIYLCLGRIDGIADVIGSTPADRESLFAAERSFTSNLVDEDTSWIVINPWIGRVTTVRNGSVSSVPNDPTNPFPTVVSDITLFNNALREARLFTTFSDTSEEQL